jgi:hypothetical protein
MPVGNELAQVTTLQLYLQSLDDCERAGILIDRAPGIKILAIEFDHYLRSFRRSERFRIGLHRDIVRNLFQPVNNTMPRAILESLRINSFWLDELVVALPSKLPLRNLKHLHLKRCFKVVPFIRMLIELGVDLVSYCVNFELGSHGVTCRGPNEALLQQMTSPKRIDMSSIGEMVCDWATVTSRASSLRSFSIDDDGYDKSRDSPSIAPLILHRSLTGFSGFCSAASSLEQLAVLSPPIDSERWDDKEGLTKFLVSTCISHRQYTV